MSARTLAVVGFLLFSSTVRAAQSTFIVDDDGGPGANFTTITQAVAAASNGDRIVVYDGTYSGFVLSEGVTILAQGLPRIVSSVSVSSVPAGQTAVISGFRLEFSGGQLSVTQCEGTVVVDQCRVSGSSPFGVSTLVDIVNADDVRFHRTKVVPAQSATAGYSAMRVSNSRVELSSCELVGGKGASSAVNPRRGGTGLECLSGSRVHVALTKVTGGRGGDGDYHWFTNGGSGGDAVRASGASVVVIAGNASTPITGGAIGDPDAFSNSNNPTPGLGFSGCLSCSLRYSGSPIVNAYGSPSVAQSGSLTIPVPEDPTLELVGNPSSDENVELIVHGAPGQNARLQQGDEPRRIADALSVIESLNNRIRLHPLGAIGAQGDARYPATIGAALPLGWTRFFQGYQIDPSSGGLDERTNSVIVVVR